MTRLYTKLGALILLTALVVSCATGCRGQRMAESAGSTTDAPAAEAPTERAAPTRAPSGMPLPRSPVPTRTPTGTPAPSETREPVVTSDDGVIAFTSERDGNAEIYVMNADGSHPRRLTDDAAYDAWPSWSPDGQRIAFPSRRDGNFEIYVVNADGTGLQRLTDTAASEDFPTWSPDGTAILFSRAGGEPGTFVMSADGGEERKLTDILALEPAWSPDGARIMFASDHEGFRGLYVMNADGGDLRKVSTTRAGENGPDWSPDGTRIAFASWQDGDGEICVMDLYGVSVEKLTDNAFHEEFPAWRPVAGASARPPAGTVISANRVDQLERLHALSGHSDRVMSLSFSADGAYLASSSMDGTIRLWAVQSGQVVHTFQKSVNEALVNDIAFSPDGRLLASENTIWNMVSGQVVHTVERSGLAAVAFSPDGSALAVALVGQPIRLWDVAGGQVFREFEEGDRQVQPGLFPRW